MAGKKKKGLSNRLAKMSDEERARYLQHRAAIEEEAKRRKEQLVTTYMKNKIKREEAFTRLNIAKINEHWHQCLRKIKVKHLKAEIEDLSTWITRIIEIKNSIIKRLVHELDESEEQYEYNFKSHLSFLDNFIDIYYHRQQELEENYDIYKNRILEKGMENMEKLKDEWKAEEDYLKTIIFAIETNFDKEQKAFVSVKQEKLEDYSNSWKAEQETMVSAYNDAMDKIWKDINSTLCEYLSLTTARRHHYIELKHLDDRNTTERLHNERLITKYTKMIEKLNNEYKTLCEDSEYQMKHLNDLQQSLSKRFFDMKQNLTSAIRKDAKQLKTLTVKSNYVIKALEKIYAKYENIQQILTCCARLETHVDKKRLKEKLEEKQREFIATENTAEKEAHDTEQNFEVIIRDDISVLSTESQFSFSKDLQMLDKMDLIIWRCNIVELDRMRLKNEKSRLISENKNLKDIITGILRDAALAPSTPPKSKYIRPKLMSAPMMLSKKYSEESSQLSYVSIDF